MNTVITYDYRPALRTHGAEGERARAFAELDRLRGVVDDARARVVATRKLTSNVDDWECADDMLELAELQHGNHFAYMTERKWVAPMARPQLANEPQGFVAEALAGERVAWDAIVEEFSNYGEW